MMVKLIILSGTGAHAYSTNSASSSKQIKVPTTPEIQTVTAGSPQKHDRLKPKNRHEDKIKNFFQKHNSKNRQKLYRNVLNYEATKSK